MRSLRPSAAVPPTHREITARAEALLLAATRLGVARPDYGRRATTQKEIDMIQQANEKP
jgi:hypothetical protein